MFCFVNMVTIQLPGAFNGFLQEMQLKIVFLQLLIETVIFNLSRRNILRG